MKITDAMIESLAWADTNVERRPVGEGWMTRAEFREAFGVGDHRSRQQLRILISKGIWEVFSGTQIHGTQCRQQIWYRLNPKHAHEHRRDRTKTGSRGPKR